MQSQEGMSLRDYFAAHAPQTHGTLSDAMTSMLAGYSIDGRSAFEAIKQAAAAAARLNYIYADEMLKARNRED